MIKLIGNAKILKNERIKNKIRQNIIMIVKKEKIKVVTLKLNKISFVVYQQFY
jgi:hypothetical protein